MTSYQSQQSANPVPGQRYRHWKGGLYTVVSVSTDAETGELRVEYKRDSVNLLWSRTVENFRGVVPETGEPRFVLIEK